VSEYGRSDFIFTMTSKSSLESPQREREEGLDNKSDISGKLEIGENSMLLLIV
jgi:hypothetical protein